MPAGNIDLPQQVSPEERAAALANRSACWFQEEEFAAALRDCTACLEAIAGGGSVAALVEQLGRLGVEDAPQRPVALKVWVRASSEARWARTEPLCTRVAGAVEAGGLPCAPEAVRRGARRLWDAARDLRGDRRRGAGRGGAGRHGQGPGTFRRVTLPDLVGGA